MTTHVQQTLPFPCPELSGCITTLKVRGGCKLLCSNGHLDRSRCLSPGKVGANAECNCWSNLGSVHQVPITAGWTESVWNTKFAWHFQTWPALGIEPQTFWSWVQRPIHWATCSSTYGEAIDKNEKWHIYSWGEINIFTLHFAGMKESSVVTCQWINILP